MRRREARNSRRTDFRKLLHASVHAQSRATEARGLGFRVSKGLLLTRRLRTDSDRHGIMPKFGLLHAQPLPFRRIGDAEYQSAPESVGDEEQEPLPTPGESPLAPPAAAAAAAWSGAANAITSAAPYTPAAAVQAASATRGAAAAGAAAQAAAGGIPPASAGAADAGNGPLGGVQRLRPDLATAVPALDSGGVNLAGCGTIAEVRAGRSLHSHAATYPSAVPTLLAHC